MLFHPTTAPKPQLFLRLPSVQYRLKSVKDQNLSNNRRFATGRKSTYKMQSMHGMSNQGFMDCTTPLCTCMIMYVQLPRYRDTHQGIVKHMIPLNLENRILHFPRFCSQDSQAVTWCTYEIVTAVVLLRPSGQAGHYRVAAFLPGGVGVWYSDDNQPATADIAEQCYVLGCLRK